MALRFQLSKRYLSDNNWVKSISQFYTATSCRSEIDEIKNKKGELVVVNPVDQPNNLPYIEHRKLAEDLINEEQLNFSKLADVPQEHVVERLVRIARAPKSSMQSGTHNTQTWIVQFDNRQRWENNLMGWISSGDPLSNLQLSFMSVEDAIAYCKKYRYPYFVEKEKIIAPRKKSYGAIFSWNKRTRSSTK